MKTSLHEKSKHLWREEKQGEGWVSSLRSCHVNSCGERERRTEGPKAHPVVGAVAQLTGEA